MLLATQHAATSSHALDQTAVWSSGVLTDIYNGDSVARLAFALYPKCVNEAGKVAQQRQKNVDDKRPAKPLPNSTPSGGGRMVKTIRQNPYSTPVQANPVENNRRENHVPQA